MLIDQDSYPKLANHPYLPLLRNCQRARYAELVSPDEAAAMAADGGSTAAAGGWLVYSELERADVERLSVSGPRQVRLTVEEFADGLPVVVITIEAGETRYIWAVPMWEPQAQDWLRDAVRQTRISLVLNALDSDLTTTLVTGKGLIQQADELLRVTKVARIPAGEAHVFHMLDAGLRLMNGAMEAASSASPAVSDVRVMVAARGANAVHIMNTFVASHQMAQLLLPQREQAVQ